MKFIALLRGINVGGKTIVKMERLREVLAANGFANVKTYIQSGNVAFDSEKTADVLESELETLLEREFFKTPVIVRSVEEIREIIDNNPFADEEFEDKLFHFIFLKENLTDEQAALMEAQSGPNENYAARGRVIYALLRNGVIESALGKDFIGKKLKLAATGRNRRTTLKLLEL